jgi:hypothetical protein
MLGYLFGLFAHLTVVERIAPEEVHTSFLNIDEYRATMERSYAAHLPGLSRAEG